MQLITNKYQTQLISSLIINNLHYNFIILNNKLIFTHSLNKLQLKDLTKLLNKHYYKYKLVWHTGHIGHIRYFGHTRHIQNIFDPKLSRGSLISLCGDGDDGN